MRVLSVQLRDFRTYNRAEATLGPGLTVVHGPNGAGKSNLLEAIYFGCTGRSPRARNERELVRFGETAARVTVRVGDGERRHELTVGYGALSEDSRPVKRMGCDGAPVESLIELPQRPLLSVFMPERLELLKGPPSVRRAHLDQLVVAFWPLRDRERRAYARVLAQRNSLLSRLRAGVGSRASLRTWDLQLARHALALRDNRAQAVALIADAFSERAKQLGLVGHASIEYRPRTRAHDEARARRRAARPVSRAIWRAGSPDTVPTATSWRCCVTGASCVSMARRASSAWPCWPCCWPSALRSRACARIRR